MKTKGIIFSVITFFVIFTAAQAELIDFEGLGLNDRDPVGTVGMATFEADASIQRSSYAFITSLNPVGNGTGDSFPFNVSRNTFITNPGGLGSAETEKTIRMIFSQPVMNLSFYAADIDSSPSSPTVEQLNAEALDSQGNSISTITYTAPTTGMLGDGEVIFIDFGNLWDIKEVIITLSNSGPNTGETALGFGVDNIEFEISDITTILGFFDESVANQTLFGKGPGNSEDNRLNAFRNMLVESGSLIDNEEIEDACVQLKDAFDRCDGYQPPPDFITGVAVPQLASMIDALMIVLECD